MEYDPIRNTIKCRFITYYLNGFIPFKWCWWHVPYSCILSFKNVDKSNSDQLSIWIMDFVSFTDEVFKSYLRQTFIPQSSFPFWSFDIFIFLFLRFDSVFFLVFIFFILTLSVRNPFIVVLLKFSSIQNVLGQKFKSFSLLPFWFRIFTMLIFLSLFWFVIPVLNFFILFLSHDYPKAFFKI